MTKENHHWRRLLRLLGVIAAALLALGGACRGIADYLDCASPSTSLGLDSGGHTYVWEGSYAEGERICR